MFNVLENLLAVNRNEVNPTLDMSKNTNGTYIIDIDKVIIDKLVIADKKLAMQLLGIAQQSDTAREANDENDGIPWSPVFRAYWEKVEAERKNRHEQAKQHSRKH
jgi:hypothetical protein